MHFKHSIVGIYYMLNTYYKPTPFFSGFLRCIAHGRIIRILRYRWHSTYLAVAATTSMQYKDIFNRSLGSSCHEFPEFPLLMHGSSVQIEITSEEHYWIVHTTPGAYTTHMLHVRYHPYKCCSTKAPSVTVHCISPYEYYVCTWFT